MGPVWKASVLGIPLPICSCGVIPVAAAMRRHGASRAAVTAFLLSTPQTGVDSIAATYALLGPVVAVFRPLAALASGMLGGLLVLVAGQSRREREQDAAGLPPCAEPCCNPERRRPALVRALSYGLVTLPRDVAWPLLLGILIGGTMAALAPDIHLEGLLHRGPVSILLLMAAGVPLYVCATASVPIAAGLILMGASPGAAFAFLVTGAATNPATFTVIWKVLGRRSALVYLGTVAVTALASGLLLDWLVGLFPAAALPRLGQHAGHVMAHGGLLPHLAGAALLAVLAFSMAAEWFGRPAARTPPPPEHDEDTCHCHER
jgi:hypothetical protein